MLHCVDIGWSPYFPLLSGLITELGGLMSHGKYVMRSKKSILCGVRPIISLHDYILNDQFKVLILCTWMLLVPTFVFCLIFYIILSIETRPL